MSLQFANVKNIELIKGLQNDILISSHGLSLPITHPLSARAEGITYVALHEVIQCVVVWCTQNAPRQQQFHVAPAMPVL